MGWVRCVVGPIALVAALAPRSAAGGEEATKSAKDQCFDAYEQAQRFRKAYQLRAAREQLIACGAEACPTFVRQDCSKWLGEVEASTPTIVVLARRADGTTVEDARATLDGSPLGDRLDGRAIAVDPGPHELRCEAGGVSVQSHIVVAEGVKNQPFYVTLGTAPAPRQTAPAPAPKEEPRERATRGLPTATWVLGGVALVGGISFATFAVVGRATQSCAPNCTQSQVDDLRRDYLIADASWITGLLAAGAAVYFALTAPAGAPAPPVTAIRW
jgi:hypothetical protein